MNRILVVTAVALSLAGTVATADAGSRKKETRYYQHPHSHMMWSGPVAMRRGPPWAGPNQCFVDEGYGRYSSCDRR